MKKILCLILLVVNAYASEIYYGQTREEEPCSIELRGLKADFFFVKYAQRFEAINIPVKFITNQILIFDYEGIKGYVYLNDLGQVTSYDYEYYKKPNYIQINCHI